jgi:hypothetical protein
LERKSSKLLKKRSLASKIDGDIPFWGGKCFGKSGSRIKKEGMSMLNGWPKRIPLSKDIY